MKHYVILSYARDAFSGMLYERSVSAKNEDLALNIADAQALGGAELVKVVNPKGQIKIHQYRKDELDA